MTPGQLDVLASLLPPLAEVARTGAVVGAVVGLVLALLLFVLQRARGWLAQAALGRGLAATWLVGAGLLWGAGAGASLAVAVSAAPTLAGSDVGQGVLRDLGGQGADVVAGTVVLAASRGMVTLPGDAPPAVEQLEAYRAGWEIPVAAVRGTADALGPALAGPDGAALGADLVAALPLTVDETWRPAVRDGVATAVAQARAGEDPSGVDPTVGEAWSRLEEAAAQGGDPAALGRTELAELLAERVIVPVLARLVQGPALVAAMAFLALFLLASLVPAGVTRIVQALRRPPSDGSA
ncbi:MAG: hypothetical protein H6732_18610 [Alphaproteobacteria bacterium]|nr:hypothetical protein [Alphaproteobacteria bacterium]